MQKMKSETITRFIAATLFVIVLLAGFHMIGFFRVLSAIRYGKWIARDAQRAERLAEDCAAIYAWLQTTTNLVESEWIDVDLIPPAVSDRIRDIPGPPSIRWENTRLQIQLLGGHIHAFFFWLPPGSTNWHSPPGDQIASNLWWYCN